MKLARKLIIALFCGILAVMSTYAYFQLRQEVVLSLAELHRARRLAKAWLGTIGDVWKREGPARAQELTERANEAVQEDTIRLIPLADARAGKTKVPLSADQWQELEAGDFIRTVARDQAGKEWGIGYVALTVGNAKPALVEYAEPREGEQSFIKMGRLALATATLAVVAVCGLIAAWLQYSLVGRPLQLLRDKARRAGQGDFSRPLSLPQKDEMGELAQEINSMCEHIETGNRKLAEETEARVAALDQLRHTDRLATVGQLAAGVAHELGTPLSVVSARAELIAGSQGAAPEIAQNARVVLEQCDRMTGIIQQLLDFSRRRSRTLGLTDLRHLVTHTGSLLSTAAEKARVELQCSVGSQPTLVYVDRNQIQQALINIMLNGIQAMPDGGMLRVAIGAQRMRPPQASQAGDAEYACVTVEDGGRGIAEAHLQHIFEPFFTTKAVGEGTGLGLAVAHGIITEHEGWIAVDSTVGKGSRFVVYLPLAETADAVRGAA